MIISLDHVPKRHSEQGNAHRWIKVVICPLLAELSLLYLLVVSFRNERYVSFGNTGFRESHVVVFIT